ncbi:MAG: SRPBCC family protein [Steroidobacteraceae bacterium]|jgi:uncharacterized protein YndB with AHSA1/START domain
MAEAHHRQSGSQIEPLVISRLFPAPRPLVFKAWSTAEHMKRWFSPETYTVPEAEIDFRAGGVCNICMRSPSGENFWSQGIFLEVSPPDRLVLKLVVGDPGAPKFTAHTTVTFAEEGAGTRMTVHQAYEIHDPSALVAVNGAPQGWGSTLDKLARELLRMNASAGSHSVVHDTFSLERHYDAAPAQVFRAFTDPIAKARWFEDNARYRVVERAMDVRPGGREHLKAQWEGGRVTTFDATYLDIVSNERLVYVYEMHLNERKISVSLATVQLQQAGAGTRLLVTEQGAFLDGYDDASSRAHGTGFLMDRLGETLQR